MPIDLVEIGPLDRRRFCDCCCYPTLGVPDEYEPDPEWSSTRTSCDLCEWDSAPLDDAGEVRSDAPSDAERNDGLSIETARSNFARFSSIYDPNDLPGWKVSAPSADVRHCRSALQMAYAEALALDLPARYEQSRHVRDWEYALSDALAAQQSREEDSQERAT